MRHGLDLAEIRFERRLDQAFAVPGNAGIGDERRLRHLPVQFAQHRHGGVDRITFIAAVERIQQVFLVVDQRRLGGRRTRVDAEEQLALRLCELLALDLVFVVARDKTGVVRFIFEQRLDVFGVVHHVRVELCKTRDECPDGDLFLLLCKQRRTDGDEELAVLGEDDLIVLEPDGLDEPLSQFGQERQRSAQERDMPLDAVPAGQTADGLVDDRLEDRRRQVLHGRAFVDQRLNIGLREHAAARRDRIDQFIILGSFIQTTRIGVEEDRHLVDERTCTAGTGTVHALLDGLSVEGDLRVLTAQLDGDIRLGDQRLDSLAARDDLLLEVHIHQVGERQTAAAGDDRAQRKIPHLLFHLDDEFLDFVKYVGHVPLVLAVDDLIFVVQYDQLDCGRTDVDA